MNASRRRRTTLLPLGATLALAACSASADPGPPPIDVAGVEFEPVAVTDAQAVPQVVASNDRLGLVMLGQAPEQGNAVVSPFSAFLALSMLAEGARGSTAETLDDALGVGRDDRIDAVSALRAVLLAHEGDPALASAEELPDVPLVHLAARVAVQEGFEVEQTYAEGLRRHFDAEAVILDLQSSDGLGELSRWVEAETGGLIEESAIEPDPLLRVVLQDVVVFAARWQVPFDATATGTRDFHAPAGTVAVEMLSGAPASAYAEADGWQAVRLPYVSDFAADLLLPPQGADPAEMPADLLEDLGEALASESARPDDALDVVVPRLDLGPQELDLTGVLEEIGLADLMEEPDLTGIAEDLRVSQAVQQAMLRLDEDGTVAAAVTEIGIETTWAAPPPPQLVFDRPFLVRIVHQETGLSLFMAVVRDPSAS